MASIAGPEGATLEIFGIRTPLIKVGDNLPAVIRKGLTDARLALEDGDIIVISAKAIGTAEGRVIRLSDVVPSPRAVRLAEMYDLEPAFAEVVISESDEILGGVKMALTTIKRGVLIANGGADQSNSPPGTVTLWPEDPQASAESIRAAFLEGKSRLGVLVTDSRTLPLRMGNSAVAIGISGFRAIEDLRGKPDLFGRPMRIKRLAVADNIASAAQLVMGETSESTPVALVRGAPVAFGEGYAIEEAHIPRSQCLIMHLIPPRRNSEGEGDVKHS